jgi:hypothetical protein
MKFLSKSPPQRKPPEISIRSTGCCPSDWRRWWHRQSQIDGTDWRSLAAANVAVVRHLLMTSSSVWTSSC